MQLLDSASSRSILANRSPLSPPPRLLGPAAAAPVDHPLARLRDAAMHLHRGEIDDETRRWLRGGGWEPTAGTNAAAGRRRPARRPSPRCERCWRSAPGSGERSTPPRFLVRQLEALVLRHPGFAGWRSTLPGWLDAWPRVPVDSLLAMYARAVPFAVAETPASAAWLLQATPGGVAA
ncbi:MAG: hypothetical protein U0736_18495 [Gemmataceae bacterium]